MTTEQLNRGLDLQDKISEKKEVLQSMERGRIHAIQFVQFDEDTGLNHITSHKAHIPRSIIKNACIKVLRDEIENLERQFDRLGTPIVENSILPDSIASKLNVNNVKIEMPQVGS